MATFDTYAQGTPCYVELATPDPAGASTFYGELFGWTLTDVSSGAGEPGEVYLRAAVEGDLVAGIAGQVPGPHEQPATWSVFLAVDDVDATVAGVDAAGGRVEAGPETVRDLGRMATVVDPTGARVRLWEAHTVIGTQRADEPGTPVWNELVTPDVETATGFYAELLGVSWQDTPVPEDSALESYRTLQVGGRAVGGAMPPPVASVPPHWNVYFNVADVEESVARAESLGGKTVVPAFDVPGVGRMAMLADACGAMFWLLGPSPEAA